MIESKIGDTMAEVEVVCKNCDKIWIDHGEPSVYETSYRNWVFCPYCGDEVTKSER